MSKKRLNPFKERERTGRPHRSFETQPNIGREGPSVNLESLSGALLHAAHTEKLDSFLRQLKLLNVKINRASVESLWPLNIVAAVHAAALFVTTPSRGADRETLAELLGLEAISGEHARIFDLVLTTREAQQMRLREAGLENFLKIGLITERTRQRVSVLPRLANSGESGVPGIRKKVQNIARQVKEGL